MTHTYLALGSNLDNPIKQLEQAFEALAKLPDTTLLKTSSVYQTAPVGFSEQPDFFNAVCHLETSLSPEALLAHLLMIEQKQLRERSGEKNGPRTLDLDILLYGPKSEISQDGLIIPHPRLTERAFVVIPLLEIAPDLILPDGRTIQEIAQSEALQKQGICKIAAFTSPLAGNVIASHLQRRWYEAIQ